MTVAPYTSLVHSPLNILFKSILSGRQMWDCMACLSLMQEYNRAHQDWNMAGPLPSFLGHKEWGHIVLHMLPLVDYLSSQRFSDPEAHLCASPACYLRQQSTQVLRSVLSLSGCLYPADSKGCCLSVCGWQYKGRAFSQWGSSVLGDVTINQQVSSHTHIPSTSRSTCVLCLCTSR